MGEPHYLIKTIVIIGTLLPIASSLIGVGIYVENLNNRIALSDTTSRELKGRERESTAKITNDQNFEFNVKKDTLSKTQNDKTIIRNSGEFSIYKDDDFRVYIEKNGFKGIASNGRKTWQYTVSDIFFLDELHFTGQIAWPSLASKNRIEGTFKDGQMFFKETQKIIPSGRAMIGCEYIINTNNNKPYEGIFTGCGINGIVYIH